MPITSIRTLARTSADYAAYRDQWVGHAVPVTPEQSSRSQPQNYRQPATLWGRIKVALSGAAARRERACARLNTLYMAADAEGVNMVNRDFSEMAMKKFAKAFIECKDEAHKMVMMASLTEYARAEAMVVVGYGKL